MSHIDLQISLTADPNIAQCRFDDLIAKRAFQSYFNRLDERQQQGVLLVLGYSDFLSNYIRRVPDCIINAGKGLQPCTTAGDLAALRQYKYIELFKLTVRDLLNNEPYEQILTDTTTLADSAINSVYSMSTSKKQNAARLCILGMGKLGSMELNYSSDIDLIFVCSEPETACEGEDSIGEWMNNMRRFSRAMEEVTADGFLYRVDLKLRPWGRSGPLILTIDDTENYYAASTEAWERFIWLRARPIAGDLQLGNALIRRLEPFVFKKSLSNDDLERFVHIKSEMQMYHHRDKTWNVKQGQGGIRDIEFFIQLLQIVNAHKYPKMKITNTLKVLELLYDNGLLQLEDVRQIRDSYLFLRRLENHLQMFDEQQTHLLPDSQDKRRLIARSMIPVARYGDTMSEFEERLSLHKVIAKNCFERIFPSHTEID